MEFKGEIHSKEYLYDFSVDGGAVGAIDLSAKAGYKKLPEGAIVKSVHAKVVTACTSGGSATLSWGTNADKDGYSGSAKAVAALTANAAFSGEKDSADLLPSCVATDKGEFEVEIAVAALTAGKVYFAVEYYLAGEKA